MALSFLRMIGGFITAALRTFINLIGRLSSAISTESRAEASGEEFHFVYFQIAEGQEVPVEALTQWPWYILSGILILGIIFVLWLVTAKTIKAIKEKMKKSRGGDESGGTGDETDKMKFSIGDLASFLPRFRFNAKHKHPIRRAYIKKVNGHIKQGVVITSSHTPEKIAMRIKEREDISELTEIYEAVRYGNTAPRSPKQEE